MSRLKLPDGLMTFMISSGTVEWISLKLKLPVGLRLVEVYGSTYVDLRVFCRHREKYGILEIDDDLFQWPREYHHASHQDAFTGFIHNRVLPVELLRHVSGFLHE